VSTPQPNLSPSETATHEPAGAAGRQAPAAHAPSPATEIVQAVPAAASVSAEQTPAPEQVPASLHCADADGQVTPAQALTQVPEAHRPSPVPASLQTVLSTLLVCAEQTPAPEQVPASVHCVEGQVTPAQALTQVPEAHRPSPAEEIVHGVLSALFAAEQVPAIEQVPASVHAVAGGQTPAQGDTPARTGAYATVLVASTLLRPLPMR
jgi:hypothetical protein